MTATDIFDLAGLLSDFQYSFRLSRSTADYLTVMTIIILKVFTSSMKYPGRLGD